MKLFVFDTCPFSARARIMAGLKELQPELIFVAPGQTPAELVGRIEKLTVPILVDDDLIIQDSGQIIYHLDTFGPVLLSSYTTSPEFDQISTELSPLTGALIHPRAPHLGVPELAGPGAVRNFEAMMSPKIGMSFGDALKRTEELVERIAPIVAEFDAFLTEDEISFDTIAAMATLRNLSTVAELELPPNVSMPFLRLMAKGRLPLFTPVTQDGMPAIPKAS